MFLNLIKGLEKNEDKENVVNINIQKLLGDKTYEKRKKGAQELAELVKIILLKEENDEKKHIDKLLDEHKNNEDAGGFNITKTFSDMEANKISNNLLKADEDDELNNSEYYFKTYNDEKLKKKKNILDDIGIDDDDDNNKEYTIIDDEKERKANEEYDNKNNIDGDKKSQDKLYIKGTKEYEKINKYKKNKSVRNSNIIIDTNEINNSHIYGHVQEDGKEYNANDNLNKNNNVATDDDDDDEENYEDANMKRYNDSDDSVDEKDKKKKKTNLENEKDNLLDQHMNEEKYILGSEIIKKLLLDKCKENCDLDIELTKPIDNNSNNNNYIRNRNSVSSIDINKEKRKKTLNNILYDNDIYLDNFNKKYQSQKVINIISFLDNKFIQSVSSSERCGGLISLAFISISLDEKIQYYFTEILRIIISCINDADSKVRYYVCESLYNLCKVSRKYIFHNIEDIFDCLYRIFSDSCPNVKSGGIYLDNLIKDLVCSYNNIFYIYKIIYILKDKIYIENTNVRQLIISWLFFLQNIPTINIFEYFHFFIKDLFLMLSDENKDIQKQANQCLDIYIDKIVTSNYEQCRTFFKHIAYVILEFCGHKNTVIKHKSLLWIYHFINILNIHFYNIFDSSTKKNNTFLIELLKKIIASTSDVCFDIHYTARKCNELLISYVKFTYLESAPLITKLVCLIINTKIDKSELVVSANKDSTNYKNYQKKYFSRRKKLHKDLMYDRGNNLPDGVIPSQGYNNNEMTVEENNKMADQEDNKLNNLVKQHENISNKGRNESSIIKNKNDDDNENDYSIYKDDESYITNIGNERKVKNSLFHNDENDVEEDSLLNVNCFNNVTAEDEDFIHMNDTDKKDNRRDQNGSYNKANNKEIINANNKKKNDKHKDNKNDDNNNKNNINDVKDNNDNNSLNNSNDNASESLSFESYNLFYKKENYSYEGQNKPLNTQTSKEENYNCKIIYNHEKLINELKEKKLLMGDVSKGEAYYINKIIKKKGNNNNINNNIDDNEDDYFNDNDDDDDDDDNIFYDNLEKRNIYPVITCLQWLIEILIYKSNEIKTYYDEIIICIFKCLKNDDNKVLLLSLTVLSAMCGTVDNKFHFYEKISLNLINIFKNDENLLIHKGKVIVQHISRCLNNKKFYAYLCYLLIKENNFTFVNKFVQVLNWVLLTSDETKYLRNVLFLKKYYNIFSLILIAWFHNPLSAISFLLWLQKYELAYYISSYLTLLDVNSDFFHQLDNFIFLFESPVFSKQRIHLIYPKNYPFLIKSLMILSLMLPLNTSNNILQKRLQISQLSILTSNEKMHTFFDIHNHNGLYHIEDNYDNKEIDNKINEQDKLKKRESCQLNIYENTEEFIQLCKMGNEEQTKEYNILEKTDTEKHNEEELWNNRYNYLLTNIKRKFLKDTITNDNHNNNTHRVSYKNDECNEFVHIFKTVLKTHKIIKYYS
ncbi:conserved Plasmodium protein, unknown function [Plasmodium sp. DRC-Itaito]|nr:conserved Plasmodium protein, unknown function [Plasmodium sp. DRC-Itaito]